jgi:hypothetical protein
MAVPYSEYFRIFPNISEPDFEPQSRICEKPCTVLANLAGPTSSEGTNLRFEAALFIWIGRFGHLRHIGILSPFFKL